MALGILRGQVQLRHDDHDGIATFSVPTGTLLALLDAAGAADGLLDLVEDIAIATTPGDHGYPEDNVYEWGKRARVIVPGAKAALARLKEAADA